ncbi:MAG: molybdopterin-guanine dinucleotide biosynthesis protein B [Candidatus Terraquivivens tikiterensis]|uniref:Molybdopterin-guanine dinucleotide biosynthesis protein B n=1 Tax=Candidatus Terraquivivens tikiterensis TaxID=1980982 RepID=A0A2R7Y3F9_9ARCH|nr:MAG: molybdopterin-guanine dinucleotide biosynthesis protein B [Candidatus Terraquivivens tikiterensis]
MVLKVVAVLGHKKSGKTRLVTMLIKALRDMNYKVASAKHVHHVDFSIDRPGKDSWKHREAGANPTIIISPGEVAIMLRGKKVEALSDLVKMAEGSDVLVLEGFYGLLKESDDAIKIALVKNAEELKTMKGEIIATFENLNEGGVYRLPEEFPQLFKLLLDKISS